MKKVLTILLSCLILLFSSVNAFAATKDGGVLAPMIIPPVTEYVHSSTTFYKSEDWTHTSNNPTDIVQNTPVTVSRTVTASFRVGYSETIDAMIAKVGVNLEVSIGTSETWTEGHTYFIPPHSSYKLIWGSQLVRESGYENYYWNGQLQSSTYATGDWSYESYDDMKYLGSYYGS